MRHLHQKQKEAASMHRIETTSPEKRKRSCVKAEDSYIVSSITQGILKDATGGFKGGENSATTFDHNKSKRFIIGCLTKSIELIMLR